MDPKVSSARLLCADQAQQDARPQEVDFVLEGILGPGTSVDGISYVGDLGTAWFKRAIQQLNRVQNIVTTLEKQTSFIMQLSCSCLRCTCHDFMNSKFQASCRPQHSCKYFALLHDVDHHESHSRFMLAMSSSKASLEFLNSGAGKSPFLPCSMLAMQLR